MKRKGSGMTDHKIHIRKTVTLTSYSTVLNNLIIAGVLKMLSAHYETSLHTVHKSFFHWSTVRSHHVAVSLYRI